MANEMNRRDLLKNFGAFSCAMAIGRLPQMLAQSRPSAAAAPRLVLHFNGLWALVVRERSMTVVTAKVGEHIYHADGNPLGPGPYALTGVRNGSAPPLKDELVIYGASQPDLQSSYAWMELPLPKSVSHPDCTVQAEFSGPDACIRSASFALRHQLHYEVNPSGHLSLGSIQIPPPNPNSEIHINISAEPPAKLNSSGHSPAAFDKLMALFPGLNIKLVTVKLLHCPTTESYANPETCIQPMMLPQHCPK